MASSNALSWMSLSVFQLEVFLPEIGLIHKFFGAKKAPIAIIVSSERNGASMAADQPNAPGGLWNAGAFFAKKG